MIFYKMKTQDVLKSLSSRENGLTLNEVKERLNKYGKNKIKEEKKQSKILKFFK